MSNCKMKRNLIEMLLKHYMSEAVQTVVNVEKIPFDGTFKYQFTMNGRKPISGEFEFKKCKEKMPWTQAEIYQ